MKGHNECTHEVLEFLGNTASARKLLSDKWLNGSVHEKRTIVTPINSSEDQVAIAVAYLHFKAFECVLH